MGCMSAGGGGATSKSTTETKTKEQKAALKELLALYMPTAGEGADIFPGARVAPFSTLQQEAITGAGQFADYFATPQKVGTPLFKETGTAIGGLLSGETGAKPLGAQDVEDYFQRAIKDPNVRYLKEETIPGIAESFAGPGFHGSARSQEEVEARKDLGEQLGTQRAALEWDVLGRNQTIEEAKAGRTLGAVPTALAYGQVPAQEVKNNLNIAAQQIGGLNQVFGFGQAEQSQAQRELQDEITRFAEENQITDPENLSILLTLVGMNFSRSQTETYGQGLGYGGASSALGAFGGEMGGNLGSKFFA